MRIDHVNIRCSDLDATRSFLEKIVGLKAGDRPAFGFPGYWMYDESGRACAHLIGTSVDLGEAGAVDHVAFFYEDIYAQAERMTAQNYPLALKPVPGINILQGFIEGPDGMKYEFQGPAS